ncbi:MAG: CARDB domain-containing protein [Bacteroidota bacterium]
MRALLLLFLALLGLPLSVPASAQIVERATRGLVESAVVRLTPSNGLQPGPGLARTADGLTATDAASTFAYRVAVPLDAPEPFLGVAVNWTVEGPASHAVRLRSSEQMWTALHADTHAPDGAQPAFSAYTTAPAETQWVEVEIPISIGSSLQEVELYFASPGASTAASEAHASLSDPTRPAIVSRTGWQCPEGQSSPRWAPQTIEVSHIAVHHTVGGASFSSDYAAYVRYVWDLHANNNGWGDIGYNYLVDPNGVIYEGRAGGSATRDVQGAHAYDQDRGVGANQYSMGVAFIGNHTSLLPTGSAQDAFVDLTAWKVGQKDLDAEGSSFMPSVGTLPVIFGHRDFEANECPGNRLHAELPALRTEVADAVGGGSGVPNLALNTCAVQPRGGVPGDAVAFGCTITNEGSAGAGPSRFGAYFSSDRTLSGGDVLLQDVAIGSLSGSQSVQASDVAFVPNQSPGEYYILLVADHQDDVDESDENDNVESFWFRINSDESRSPDLLVDGCTTTASSIPLDGEFGYACDVRNAGDEEAGDSSLGVYLSTDTVWDDDDERLDSERMDPIAAEATQVAEDQTNDLPSDTSPGSYFLLFVADRLDEVEESNEANNVRSLPFTVTSNGGDELPNLVVQSIDAPPSVQAGGAFTFDFVVAELSDIGIGDFNRLVRTVAFDMEYVLLDGGARISVGARTNATGISWPFDRERGYTGLASMPADLEPGTYEIVVEVDTNNEVDESNEGDNTRSFTVRVEEGDTGADLPNLVVQSVDAPSSAEAGSTLPFDFVVAEVNGAPDFETNVQAVRFDMEYVLVDGNTRTNLGGRENDPGDAWPTSREQDYDGRATLPTDLAPGTYEIVVEVDTEDEVTESDESDNARSFFVEVDERTAQADAFITNYDILSEGTVYAPEDIVTVGFTFCWSDGVGRDASWSAWESLDAQLDATDSALFGETAVPAEALDGGGCLSTTFQGLAAAVRSEPGERYWILVIDADDDADRTNNQAAVSFTVADEEPGPAIEVLTNPVEFGDVLVGESTIVPLLIKNVGDEDLEVSLAMSSGAVAFSVPAFPEGTLPVGGSGAFAVQFDPPGVGTWSEELLLTHSGTNVASPISVSLRGQGIEASGNVQVSLPEARGSVGETVVIPITLAQLGNGEVLAYNFELAFDTAILAFQGASKPGTLSEDWFVESNSASPGKVRVSAAGSQPIAGDGVLLDLVFVPVADGRSDLSWLSFRLNEGDPAAATSSGSVTVSSCGPCGDVTGNGEVTSLDASHVLQASVGSAPEGFRGCAADPTQDGTISPLDASLILQYDVGIRSQLECGAGAQPMGPFVAKSSTTETGSTPALASWSAPVLVNGMWTLPIVLNQAALALQMHLTLEGPAEVTLDASALPGDWMVVQGSTSSGIHFALAGTTPLPEGWVLPLTVSRVDTEGTMVSGTLQVNERQAEALPAMLLVEVPEAFALSFVYPNPTSTSASLDLALPEAAELKLDVYDVLGRHLVTLADARLEAGRHTVSVETGGLSAGRYFIVGQTPSGPIRRAFTVIR